MSVRTVVSLYPLLTRIQYLLERLTEDRAKLLDNLKWEYTSGVFDHQNTVEEQTVIELIPTELILLEGVLLYLHNLTKKAVIRTYVKDNLGEYRRLDIAEYPTDFPPGTEVVLINSVSCDSDLKITLQSLEAEGEVRQIPYKVVTRWIG